MPNNVKSLKSRGSSVVERIIGNDEVGSSILPRGTSFSYRCEPFPHFQNNLTCFLLFDVTTEETQMQGARRV